jgi:hypothetical protein
MNSLLEIGRGDWPLRALGHTGNSCSVRERAKAPSKKAVPIWIHPALLGIAVPADVWVVMASLGLKSFRPYFNHPNSGSWGQPNEAISANFQGDESASQCW